MAAKLVARQGVADALCAVIELGSEEVLRVRAAASSRSRCSRRAASGRPAVISEDLSCRFELAGRGCVGLSGPGAGTAFCHHG